MRAPSPLTRAQRRFLSRALTGNRGRGVSGWSADKRTANSLVARGLIEQVYEDRREWYRVTDAGRIYLEASRGE